jgi:hypothetical protein
VLATRIDERKTRLRLGSSRGLLDDALKIVARCADMEDQAAA